MTTDQILSLGSELAEFLASSPAVLAVRNRAGNWRRMSVGNWASCRGRASSRLRRLPT